MEHLNWDHSMINVQSLDEAVQLFAKHGIIFQRGGKHQAWGTANALGYFGINYIELISVFDQKRADSFTRSEAAAVYDAVQDFKQQRQRLNTVAIRSTDLQATWHRLKATGIPVSPIEQGERLDEQQRLIRWKIFFIDGQIEGMPYPFFIDWQSPDTARIAQLREQKLIQSHPAGDLKVVAATFTVTRPQEVAQKWATLLASSVVKGSAGFEVPVQERTFEFVAGTANHLSALHFTGAQGKLKGKSIKLGEAQLFFE